jgi:hypothetical protein
MTNFRYPACEASEEVYIEIFMVTEHYGYHFIVVSINVYDFSSYCQ